MSNRYEVRRTVFGGCATGYWVVDAVAQKAGQPHYKQALDLDVKVAYMLADALNTAHDAAERETLDVLGYPGLTRQQVCKILEADDRQGVTLSGFIRDILGEEIAAARAAGWQAGAEAMRESAAKALANKGHVMAANALVVMPLPEPPEEEP